MTPERMREILEAMGRTQTWVAGQIGSSDRAVRDWAAGVYAVPEKVGEWLEAYYTRWQLLESLGAQHPEPTPPPREEWLGAHPGRPKGPAPRRKEPNYTFTGRAEYARLSEADVRAIRRQADRKGLAELGRQYGVSRQTIRSIIQRLTWAWLD